MLARGGKRTKAPNWTPAEDEVVRTMYRAIGDVATAAMLPGRSLVSVQKRASALGCAIRPDWSPSEDKQLILLWESGLRLSAIAKQLGRPAHGVYNRALKLGMQAGCPQGFEYLSAAMQRAGFNSTDQLRRVLKWAGVQVHMALSQPKTRHVSWHHHYVDPTQVDEAVARWVRSETLVDAAKRHGISDMIMRKWLLRAGVIGARMGARTHRRVDPEVVDRVMAERKQKLVGGEPMAKDSEKRCYCGLKLGADGKCEYACPPEANPAHLREQRRKRLERDRAARAADRIGVTGADQRRMSDVTCAIDPIRAKERARWIRGATRSHGPGARR